MKHDEQFYIKRNFCLEIIKLKGKCSGECCNGCPIYTACMKLWKEYIFTYSNKAQALRPGKSTAKFIQRKYELVIKVFLKKYGKKEEIVEYLL